jgi:hypothetical protein
LKGPDFIGMEGDQTCLGLLCSPPVDLDQPPQRMRGMQYLHREIGPAMGLEE